MKLGLLIEAKDKIDNEILNGTINMIFGLKLDNFLLRDKKNWENYFDKVLSLSKSLLKANEHYRKYTAEEKRLLPEYREKCLKDSNTNLFLSIDPVSLNSEIDGVLSQIKASLDMLAKSLNNTLKFKLTGWHKKKDENGIEKSGLEIIKVIDRNLEERVRIKSAPLREYIKKNVDWITYLVYLRDKIHHHGGIKNVSEIIFDYRTKDVLPQMISHNEEHSEPINEFLLRTIKEVSEFTRDILILSLESIAPNGMIITKNKKDEWPHYHWAILNSALKNDKNHENGQP